MPYVTKADMIDRYTEGKLRELTDREPPYAGTIVDAVLDRAIASADKLIDGYLGRRYVLPLVWLPDLLTDVAARLAFAGLYIETAPEKVTADYQAAMRTLRDIAAGEIVLEVGGIEAPTADPLLIETSASERVFDRDSLRNW